MKSLKKAAYACLGLLLMAASAGCSKKYEEIAVSKVKTVVETKEPASTAAVVLETKPGAEEETKEPENPEGKVKSYLTGELIDAKKGNRRPVAVMMENDRAALPQYGINRAGVVYEAPVESGINRYMALIEDYDDLDRIGSVRSCRTYYTYFAREFDAIYVHYGQSTFAKPYLNNVDNINGLDGIGTTAFYRSKDKKSPHNAYTSGGRIRDSIKTLGYRTEYSDSYQGHFRFAKDDKQFIPDGEPAYKVIPGYPVNNPWFEYQENEGVYHRFQFGDRHNGNEGQIAVKNIIFQYVEWGHYATTEYLNINVHTGHEGYYFSNGRCQKITWKKDGEFGVTHYYDLDGNEITLNKGKTWICIIGTDRYNKAEIYGN